MAQKEKTPFDLLIKVLVVGDSAVGKTNMLMSFCDKTFMPTHLITIGIDFKLKHLNIDGCKVRLQIWDTAGQERYKTITQNYYRGAMGIVLTYAVDDRESFKDVVNWMNQIQQHGSNNVVKILVANKVDIKHRQVTTEEGMALAERLGVKFFETSAKNGTGIEECFMYLTRTIKSQIYTGESVGVLSYTGSKIARLNKDQDEKTKQNSCC